MTDEVGISAAAILLGVSRETLRAWDAKGLLVPTRTPGNRRRWKAADLLVLRDKLRRLRLERAELGQGVTPMEVLK